MAIYKPSQETFSNQRFSAIIYGAPGTGKTTLACSAPNPILVDLDKGLQRIRAQHRTDFIRVDTYEQLLADLESEELKEYETIVIDTGGSLITYMQNYVMKQDPSQNKTKSGTISIKGHGAVKAEFQRLTNWLKTTLNKNIIYVFHSIEEKNKDNTVQRLLCEGSSKNIVWQPCDFGGYVYMNGDQRVIGFTPTDEYFAKGCYGINGVRKIPTLGDADKNDYITRLFAEANANIAKDNDFFKAEREEYEKVMEEGRKMIESWDKPEQFTNGSAELNKLSHKLTSLVELKAICKERITALGFVWDREKKAYVSPAKEDSKTDQTETKKKGRDIADDILNGLTAKGEKNDDRALKGDTANEKTKDGENAEKTAKE